MQSLKDYAWKLAGLAKGIDVNDAVKELQRVESLYGSLTPENVLNASRDESALFHSLFEWEDSIAAEHYRLQQARTILNNIEVKIISSGEEKKIAVYEVIKNPIGQHYKSIESMNADDIAFVKTRTLKELNILKDKLSMYKQFNNIVTQLTTVITTLTNVTDDII